MNSTAKYWYLHDHHLFDELAREAIDELAYLSHFQTSRKGALIHLPADESRIYTIKVGIFKLVETDQEGQEQLIEILRPGDLFGQFTLNQHTSNQYTVALSDYVTFCSFATADMEQVMQQHPTLGIRYTKLIGLRFRRLENLYKNLMFKDVRTRLRLFLKEWVAKEAKPDRPAVVPNYLSHKDISRLICSNRQAVTELFNEFRGTGQLAYDRNEITIIDPMLLNV
ncbi:Crp/Fnr family transcriptional regulator [Fibrella aquatilis]|uniref:Crp/Fnr family transcriptional regulator n=1 Tax=Fibrella aquatilis TaxID=2817059 RepID=A0A939G7A0_9BACT|nr:Crp/Fnr family transcriptional regulator [Fibrella aquatilis]MBO0932330.1 Crp/Fnr family transcriptional regulator [Fibrella aquatilis]